MLKFHWEEWFSHIKKGENYQLDFAYGKKPTVNHKLDQIS